MLGQDAELLLPQERLGTPASLGPQQGLAGQEEASRSTEMLLSGLGDGPGEGQGRAQTTG